MSTTQKTFTNLLRAEVEVRGRPKVKKVKRKRKRATVDTVAAQLEQIARDVLQFETLDTRLSDSLDFHEVSVWRVRRALEEAYVLGLRAARDENLTGTRREGRVVPVAVPAKGRVGSRSPTKGHRSLWTD
jgi:hypothetical protein